MFYKDEDTGITHIRPGQVTLCGLMMGWTERDVKPVTKKWGITCKPCQEELEELRKIRK